MLFGRRVRTPKISRNRLVCFSFGPNPMRWTELVVGANKDVIGFSKAIRKHREKIGLQHIGPSIDQTMSGSAFDYRSRGAQGMKGSYHCTKQCENTVLVFPFSKWITDTLFSLSLSEWKERKRSQIHLGCPSTQFALLKVLSCRF